MELTNPEADWVILLLEGGILWEDRTAVAIGNRGSSGKRVEKEGQAVEFTYGTINKVIPTGPAGEGFPHPDDRHHGRSVGRPCGGKS